MTRAVLLKQPVPMMPHCVSDSNLQTCDELSLFFLIFFKLSFSKSHKLCKRFLPDLAVYYQYVQLCIKPTFSLSHTEVCRWNIMISSHIEGCSNKDTQYRSHEASHENLQVYWYSQCEHTIDKLNLLLLKFST